MKGSLIELTISSRRSLPLHLVTTVTAYLCLFCFNNYLLTMCVCVHYCEGANQTSDFTRPLFILGWRTLLPVPALVTFRSLAYYLATI